MTLRCAISCVILSRTRATRIAANYSSCNDTSQSHSNVPPPPSPRVGPMPPSCSVLVLPVSKTTGYVMQMCGFRPSCRGHPHRGICQRKHAGHRTGCNRGKARLMHTRRTLHERGGWRALIRIILYSFRALPSPCVSLRQLVVCYHRMPLSRAGPKTFCLVS